MYEELYEHHFKEHHTPDYERIEELEKQLAEKHAELTKLKESCIPLSQDSKDQFIHTLLHRAARNEERLTQELTEARVENEKLSNQINILIDNPNALTKHFDAVAEARQQAARGIISIVEDARFELPEFILKTIKTKFGLEG